MKIGVIADIHGNQPAFEAALAALDEHDLDDIVCIGDIVGVLGAPDACVSMVRDTCAHAVYGNHDVRFFPSQNWVPVRDVDIAEYEQVMDDLSDDNFDWLTSLPETKTVYGNVTLVHAKPEDDDPVGFTRENAGVFPREFIEVGGDYLDGGILLMGHTHEQHAVDLSKFEGQSGLVLNPGSIGFPFDKDATVKHRAGRKKEFTSADPTGVASFAVVDTETQEYELESVEYDAKPVQNHIDKWGFY